MMMARFHRGPSALTYIWFYYQVRNHGPWDYKNQRGRKYAAFGNFNYGAVGAAAGIPDQILLRGAGAA
ncbi:polymorphic toxin type 44 domain-containing protein [Enterobacter sp. R1(2018)]|uniref:polymorphic toxin type 44 domain-containing protein n=1 Tax=Enterobacter sp. R1(2018) TaxID=2447891 RepID=UPI002877C833|nr:polymorphic toxin type 44 domain-containing protein [Enterobacter sp. R1(2018)]